MAHARNEDVENLTTHLIPSSQTSRRRFRRFDATSHPVRRGHSTRRLAWQTTLRTVHLAEGILRRA